MFVFQVLETCVKNCGHRFHMYVCSKEFVEGVLVRAILPKNNPPMILHERVLSLIQVRVMWHYMSVITEVLTSLLVSWSLCFRRGPMPSGTFRLSLEL